MAHRQQEEGDEVQSFVTLVGSGYASRGEAKVSRKEGEDYEGGCGVSAHQACLQHCADRGLTQERLSNAYGRHHRGLRALFIVWEECVEDTTVNKRTYCLHRRRIPARGNSKLQYIAVYMSTRDQMCAAANLRKTPSFGRGELLHRYCCVSDI